MSSAIVIGGGLLGVSAAWRLAEKGVGVTLLEAGSLGDGASRASFAWFNASSNAKPPQPYHQLNVDGMTHYRRLWHELDAPRWLHFNGHVEWEGAEGGAEDLRKKVDQLRSWGYTVETLPISDLSALEPDLVAPVGVEEFVYYPQEGYVDPVDTIGALAARARAHGAHIQTNTTVTDLIIEGGRVTGVVTGDGDQLSADVIVSCTGRLAPKLLKRQGVSLPMAPTTGMVAVTTPSTAQLRAVHHGRGMTIRPDGAGRIMMRHYDFDDMISADTPESPVPSVLDQLLGRVANVLPALSSARVESARIATRPIPGDQLPAVGPIPGLDGLYVMVTHSGVTLGPLLGLIAAQEITTGVPDPRLTDFRPERLITATQRLTTA